MTFVVTLNSKDLAGKLLPFYKGDPGDGGSASGAEMEALAQQAAAAAQAAELSAQQVAQAVGDIEAALAAINGGA